MIGLCTTQAQVQPMNMTILNDTGCILGSWEGNGDGGCQEKSGADGKLVGYASTGMTHNIQM